MRTLKKYKIPGKVGDVTFKGIEKWYKKEFEELLSNSKEVAKKFINLLAKNIADKENHLISIAYNSLRKKVADALVVLKNKYHNQQEENFKIDISRENLANIAGTATESLIRTLSDFKNEKLIDIKEGHITIINYNTITRSCCRCFVLRA
jgi:CRP-like cAMP-binding protein